MNMHMNMQHICVSTAVWILMYQLSLGALHEYNGHECLLLRYIYYSPPMHVVSGRMARADGVYIGLERPGLPGAWRSRGAQADGHY